jgi:hypothetical protein
MAKKASKPKKTGKKAAKPSKDEEVETVNLSLLSGNQPPTKDLMYHVDNIAGWMDKASTAQGKVSDAKKKAKEAGVDVAAIMSFLKFQRMDPLDMAAQLRQLATMAAEAGLPVQISLFEPKYGTIEEQAGAEGYQAGSTGRTPDTKRWPEGAPGHVQYMRRWNDAQAEIITGGKTAA